MKRFCTLLLTLVLSLSMLSQGAAVLPAVYAYDETPAVQSGLDAEENDEDSETPDPEEEAEPDGESSEDDVTTDDQAAGDDQDSSENDETVPSGTGDDEDADLSEDKDGDTEEAVEEEETGDPEESEAGEQTVEFGSYDKIRMIDLDDAKKIVLPEDVQDSIKLSRTKYGKGLLLTGSVADLNSSRITLDYEFDFDDGSVGRLTLDGLRDKDTGMKAEVEVYLDDSSTPAGTVLLRKQMGKKDWSNDGEKTFSLGTSEISGKHRVSLQLKISGKEDDDKVSVMLRSLQFCRTTIPIMYFNIDESEGTIEAMNSSEDHSVECYGSVDLVVPDTFADDKTFSDEYGKQKSKYGIDLEYIRGRGNSTWMDDKKPYKVKFDKGQNLFGFGKNKHWILLANRYDNSLIRNRMTYWLGQQLGMEYTPQCVPVEVVMNGEYYGSYLLCEQIRVGEGRVEIDDLDKQDDDPSLTEEERESGGYLLSMDYEEDPDKTFVTDQGMMLFIESPDDNVTEYSDYIKAYTQKVENAIFGEGFMDAGGHPYTDYLDIDAAVDYWWIQEFSENGDAYGSGSTYLYKKRMKDGDPGKLYWGPLWDFDYVAWGDLDYSSEPTEDLNYTSTPWFDRMKTDPVFIEKVRERWLEPGGIRDKMQEVTKEGGRLDLYLRQMETSYTYDHDKYGAFESEITEYRGEIEQLRAWINKRIGYVDAAVEELKIEDHVVKFVIDGKTVKTVTVHGFLSERDFPEEPKKTGFVFSGWIDEDYNDYIPGSRVTKDLTLTASFIDENDIVHAKDLFFRTYEAYTGVVISSDAYNEDVLGWYFQDYCIVPEEAWDEVITWTSSDESIATIEDEFAAVEIHSLGDVTITGTLKNGVSKSYILHIVNEEEMGEYEGMAIDRTSMTMKVDDYEQIVATLINPKGYDGDIMWMSSDEEVATVNDIGVVKANNPGKTEIMLIDTNNREILKCEVTVKPRSNEGLTVKRSGSTYKITSDKKGNRTAMLVKAKNASKVVIPASIKYDGKKYHINKIKAKAFAKSKATKVTVKTKRLRKATVKGSLKGSKVKTILVRVGKTKTNKAYVNLYWKIFTKKNAGRRVVVK